MPSARPWREQDLAPLSQPEVEMVQGEEGKPVLFKAVVQVRPAVKLGDFEHFGFSPKIEAVDETMVEKVVDELRDDQAGLEPVRAVAPRRATTRSSRSSAPVTASPSMGAHRSACP